MKIYQVEELVGITKKNIRFYEEIKLLQNGKMSVSQCMSAQIERIEKEQQNAQVMKELCNRLKNEAADIKHGRRFI